MTNLPNIGDKIRIHAGASICIWKDEKPVYGGRNHAKRMVTVKGIETDELGRQWILWKSRDGMMAILAA